MSNAWVRRILQGLIALSLLGPRLGRAEGPTGPSAPAPAAPQVAPPQTAPPQATPAGSAPAPTPQPAMRFDPAEAGPGMYFQLGLAAEGRGDWLRVRWAFERYLAEVPPPRRPAAYARRAEQGLLRASEQLGRLLVSGPWDWFQIDGGERLPLRGPADVRVVWVTPGRHLLRSGTSDGPIDISSGEEMLVRFPLPPPVPPRPPPSPRKVGKWLLLSAGLVLGGIGAALWAVDPQPGCELQPEQVRCPTSIRTNGFGIAFVAIGIAAEAGAAALFGLDARAGRERPRIAGLGLGWRF